MKSASSPILRCDLHQAPQAFARHQDQIVEGRLDGAADPGLDRRRIGRVVDRKHRTLHDIRALLGEQAGKLRFLARFQDQDAVAVQSFSHNLAAMILKPFLYRVFCLSMI